MGAPPDRRAPRPAPQEVKKHKRAKKGESSEYDRWYQARRPHAPRTPAWVGGLLVAALTAAEMRLFLSPSWWGTWPVVLVTGALTTVPAVGALRAGQTASPEDQEFGSLGIELVLIVLASVGVGLLAWLDWGLAWWAATGTAVAMMIVLFVFAVVVGYASSRPGQAHCASAVALGSVLIGGAVLILGAGVSVWAVGLAVPIVWVVLANLLARILAIGAAPAPPRPSLAASDGARGP